MRQTYSLICDIPSLLIFFFFSIYFSLERVRVANPLLGEYADSIGWLIRFWPVPEANKRHYVVYAYLHK